ncbi:MAG TPA: aminotransferase class IV [Candidatus Sericytochromatia bacterium]
MSFEATPIVWHNGRLVEREQADPSIASHSLHLGIGVFDGIMAYWNSDRYYIHRLDAHLNRLRHGATNMGLGFSWSNEDLKLGIESLLEELPPTNYYIRPIVYRKEPQLVFREEMPVAVTILAVTIPRDLDKPLTSHISSFERVSGLAIPVTWKICGVYVNSYLSRRAAELKGFDDAIMLDQEGKITEATAANLFLLQQETVVTPKLTPNIFPGITRATLLDIAQSIGIEVIERDIRPDELGQFNGAFLAATMMELKALTTIFPFEYDSSNHPLFRRFLQEFREITHQ